MSIFDRFNNQFGSLFGHGTFGQSRYGQSQYGQGSVKTGLGQTRQPQTMAEWKTLVDGMTRHERDKLWPGMHKDLIPATEMIDAMNNPAAPQAGSGTSQSPGYAGNLSTLPMGRKTGFGLGNPSALFSPSDQVGALPAALSGQSMSGLIAGQKLPQSMAEWKSLVDGMTRHERDRLWPGMHKDLIPATEVITGGDPNWGMEEKSAGIGVSSQLGAGVQGFGYKNDEVSTEPPERTDDEKLDELSLDELWNLYQMIADEGEARGHHQAARTLRHFLSASGRELKYDPEWLLSYSQVKKAVKHNVINRIKRDCVEVAEKMSQGQRAEYTDFWDRSLKAPRQSDLFYTSNKSAVKSAADLDLHAGANGVVTTGKINHHWYDYYDWHPGLYAPFKYKGRTILLNDKHAKRLVKAGRAAEFPQSADWSETIEWIL